MTPALKDNLSSMWKEWLNEVMTSKVLTLFEPERKTILNIRIGQARFISAKLTKSPDGSFIQFPQPYGSHTTLAGIWMFLEKDHMRKYLVTAFGKCRGKDRTRPAQFYGLHISHGSEHDVKFSPACIDYIQKHIAGIGNAEILICHNHRRNFVTDLLCQIIDWSPLPSNTDRETMYQFKYRAMIHWLASSNFRKICFFLIEDGRLREIQLPPVNRIAKMLRELTSV